MATKKKKRNNKSINQDHQEKMENPMGACAKGSGCPPTAPLNHNSMPTQVWCHVDDH